jgi:hypothetical protein
MSMEQPDSQDSNTPAPDVEDQNLPDDLDQLDVDSPAPEEEDEEVEIGDKKFALPKSAAEKLKAERLMQADYTRKTQEVAAERKQIETRAAEVTKQHQESQQYISELAKVVAIDDQLAQYQNLPWQQLYDTDPVEAMKLDNQFRALQGQRQTAANAVTQKQQQNALAEQQTVAKQVQEAEAYFAREIPGWSGERSGALMKYGVAEGLPGDVLSQAVLRQPALAKILHKAEMYDQLAKKQSAKPKPETQDKPVTRISAARAGAQKDPEKMSMDEWAVWRNQQRNKKR